MGWLEHPPGPEPLLSSSSSMPDDGSSMAQQLQLSAAHLPILRAIMQRELQSLTPRSPQLALAGRIQQRQDAQPAQQGRVEVVPLLGLCLRHILHTSVPPSQQDSAGMHPAAGEAAPAAEVYAAMQQHSPFLNALQSELRSLRAVSGTCYAQIKQHLASVGQHLPPAAAGSSSGGSGSRASCDAAANNTAGKGDRTTITITSNGSSSDYYGRGLDLQALQQQADAGALDLIHLEDCISSCATSLAKLAQQYDVLISAALAAAAEHAHRAAAARPQDALPAKAAAAASHKAGGLLRPLLGAMRGGGSKQAGSKDAAAAASQQQTADAVEYVFMSPGICSHSNAAQTYGYTAGVPPDVYSTCAHKLLSHSDSAERVLWMLSVINARLRHAASAAAAAAAAAAAGAGGGDEGTAAGGVKQWRAPDRFTRSTTKFWVHPSNLLRLKLALTKQLPLLVYGTDDPVSSGDIAAVAAPELAAGPGSGVAPDSSQQAHKVTSLVSSVYFDGPELPVYHTRLARLDGARLVRVRYYGQRQSGAAGDEQKVFVEQKTHHEKGTGETSFKERASLQQSQMSPFLSREVPLKQLVGPASSKKLEHLGQIQDFLGQKHQTPVLRTEYYRSAWQAYDDNAVRFSLDEHMLLLREGGNSNSGGSGSAGSWCSPLESLAQIPGTDAVRFPYGILEIKLQDKEGAPAWVHALTTSGVLVEVPKFSKFLHGMALLQPDRIREVPSWFVWREEQGVALPASLDEVWDMTAERRARKAMDWQDRLEADPAALAGSSTTELAAMLVLLRAPRAYAGTSVTADAAAAVDLAAALSADAASKPPLAAANSYDLTATAAATRVPADSHAAPVEATAAASGAPARATATAAAAAAAGLHSYPCQGLDANLATTSSHSASSACACEGPAQHSIMQDGQFGCAGDRAGNAGGRASSGGGVYQGPGGGMQPQLGLMVLPGRKDSFLCNRGAVAHPASDAGSPLAGGADQGAGVKGGSPGAHALSVRLTVLPHNRSLTSSSSMGSSDLHASNSSSSLGLGAAHADLPHFTALSSSASHCSAHSPAHHSSYLGSTQGNAGSATRYPTVHLAPAGSQGAAGAGRSGQRPHSRSGSSGGTSDSWKLSTVNPLFAAGSLARSSVPEAAAGEGLMGGDAAAGRPADALRAGCSPYLRTAGFGSGSDQDARGPVGSGRKGGDLVIDFSKLAAQAAAPSAALTAAALAAGAGRQQVIQVHYTGAVETVPVPAHASPHPSPRQVRELAQLLPPAAGAGQDQAAETALAAAVDAAETGRAGHQGVDGVAAADKDISRKGGRGHRLKQWRAALSGRMKGSRGKGAAAGGAGSVGPAFSLRSNSSVNEHMLGFAGTGPRQPTYVKPRTDPKTFFANERTFLQWLQISVLVMMTGLGMLTGSSIAISAGGSCKDNMICSASRISGAIIAPVSILFMVYAIYLYQKRTHQLLTRSTLRYDDARGPWLLTVLLIVVTIVVIVLALEAYKVSVSV